MSEQAPTSASPALEKREAELARKRARLEHEERVHEGTKAFGVYDEGVAPADGELTYEQYLAQRPSEGVVRSFDGFRDAQSGKFVAEEAYEEQKAANTPDDSYSGRIEAAVRSNEGVKGSPYENMGVVQLAKEASLARSRQDRTAFEDIQEAVEHHLMAMMTKPRKGEDDSETPEEAQARYDADMARFNALIERFDNLRASAGAKADTTPEPETVEPAPEQASLEEEAAPTEALLDGEKVSITNVFESLDHKKVAQVVDGKGKVRLVFEEELAPIPEEQKEEANEPDSQEVVTPAFVVDSKGEIEVVGQDPAQGKELERYVGAQGREVEVVPSEVKDEIEGPSRRERIKNWFKKEAAHYREFGGTGYWGEKWHRAMMGTKNVLNIGITEEMSEAEKEKKRKRNRVIILVGVGALATTAIGLAVHGVMTAGDVHGATGGAEVPTLTPKPGGVVGAVSGGELPTPTPKAVGSVEHGVNQLPLATGDTLPGADVIAPSPEASAFPPEAFNIPRGLGGEELFTNLGIDPSKWYSNERTLLSQFPSDFYLMSDGHVGIAHSGMLSQGAQDFISTLK